MSEANNDPKKKDLLFSRAIHCVEKELNQTITEEYSWLKLMSQMDYISHLNKEYEKLNKKIKRK